MKVGSLPELGRMVDRPSCCPTSRNAPEFYTLRYAIGRREDAVIYRAPGPGQIMYGVGERWQSEQIVLTAAKVCVICPRQSS